MVELATRMRRKLNSVLKLQNQLTGLLSAHPEATSRPAARQKTAASGSSSLHLANPEPSRH
jgi:hypothetical protein